MGKYNRRQQRLLGILMALIGAGLWGLSGTVAQHLFHHYHVPVNWLVSIRLTVSGFLLLMFALSGKKRSYVWEIWRFRQSVLQMAAFSIFGMLGVQYTYFAAVNTGNAAVATLLQYLAPLFIAIYLIIKYFSLPKFYELFAMGLALLGTFLLLTNGSLNDMAVSYRAVIWGVLSGITSAFYTLASGRLIKKWDSAAVIGWGMMLGGITLYLIHPVWHVNTNSWQLSTVLMIGFVVIFGTLIGFYLFIESLKFISAKEASLLGCTEPLAAVFSSVIWLNITFGLYQAIGTVCVIMMVIILSIKPDTQTNKQAIERANEQ
ncbi:drug/metabolite transporter (DMT)-like permease [Scopulibacillus daqui]|uniref:Drug/metabolite transporter (DMT)-like permease n=1 Tax=Scopulibacillus daqui TaxID=1469162 RepID=A0ABS2PY06_9BACL|nr:DMT family transporter [Scopulibacillus daqui]MBM7644197.1 drug/metabolite transporter (DMT)-like permease [Scopulibacillus daqui]